MKKLSRHYDSIDPHKSVSTAKKKFFSYVLNHLGHSNARKRSILDVGCGYGYFLEMASHKKWRTKGVEVAKIAVEESRKRFGDKNIFYGTLREAEFDDDSFDAVTCWDVLAYVENPAGELKECFRILKNGGKLGIRTRNVALQILLYRLYSFFRKPLLFLDSKKPYVFNYYCYSKSSLYLLLKRLGYTNIQIKNSPLTRGDPYGHLELKKIISIIKYLIACMSEIIFRLSNRRWVLSPSLLIWAEKPHSSSETGNTPSDG